MLSEGRTTTQRSRYIALVTDSEGRLVGKRYLLVRSLGHGGMGEVWQAWDKFLHRHVAVKEVLRRAGAAQRTLREARAAAKLRHPGIVKVHDVITDDDRPWIVMELIDGRSLADCLRADGQLTERRAAEIGMQVVRALDVAHQQGVVHRDVKPSNIMLDGDLPILTDFGIAFIEGGTAITPMGEAVGSWEYMAPERFKGLATSASDLWSVGIVLYEVVVGRTPFRYIDMASTARAIMEDDLVKNYSTDRLWPVIEGLLRKDPAERLTAEAAVSMLAEVAGTAPSAPVSQETVPAKPVRTQLARPVPVTDPRGTDARTRHDAGAFAAPPDPDVTQPVVLPGDVTEEPFVPPRPRRSLRPMWVVLGAVVVVAALVFVAISLWPTPEREVTLVTDTSQPGFVIDVPAGWTRSVTDAGTISDAQWQGVQDNPKIGGLTVDVLSDPSTTAPYSYLVVKDGTENNNHRDNHSYQRLNLTNTGTSQYSGGEAELEYTYKSAATNTWFHVRYRAMLPPSHLYLLKFSMSADDEQTLKSRWGDAQPTLDKIRDSFHPR
ncbi:serine/threonine protein kinase [Actinocrispum wychmicini]|uniref:non-specific serine/threonine protein kinase n=1 Tax=Actinocrispum wychmicini TaxID=1213861 RepID=A0A4R2IIA7_9PSEU|nr:serine/threonine protein kinase [Actinocrispum wychmicini]